MKEQIFTQEKTSVGFQRKVSTQIYAQLYEGWTQTIRTF